MPPGVEYLCHVPDDPRILHGEDRDIGGEMKKRDVGEVER